MSGRWRRWRPRGNQPIGGNSAVPTVALEAWEVFETVTARLQRLSLGKRFWRHGPHHPEALEPLITDARRYALQLSEHQGVSPAAAAAWLYVLVLQAPRAAEAQLQMDRHPHGYHDKAARLYELIDFNDAFVSTVLALPQSLLGSFPSVAKGHMDALCKRTGTRCFSDEEFAAIVQGLSREIAVYQGALAEGFTAEMTSRTSDAFGIDMQIIDPRSMRGVNVDVKARSAYHYRVANLEREGRLSEEAALMADRNGFIAVYNGHGTEKKKVVLWRIDPAALGDIVEFRFADTAPLGTMLRKILLFSGEPL